MGALPREGLPRRRRYASRLLLCALAVAVFFAGAPAAYGQDASGEKQVKGDPVAERTLATRPPSLDVEEVSPSSVVLRSLSEASEALPALKQTVSVRVQGESLEEALRRIAEKAGVPLAYSTERARAGARVTLTLEDVPAYAAFREALAGTGLTLKAAPGGRLVLVDGRAAGPRAQQAAGAARRSQASLLQKTQALLPQTLRSRAQMQGTLTGVVTDSVSGETLPGVNVLLVGTSYGASTGANGRYEITGVAPGTYQVQASFVGYGTKAKSVEINEGETAEANFVLSQAEVGLDEVVVVGYGSEQREDVTGAISSVSAQEMEDDVGTTLDQALQGRVAGVTVVRNTGRPGGDVSIRVRGLGALNVGSSEPLYVIDGVPISGDSENGVTNPLATINPQDIKSVDILKDASSAAIYGSRASNGVVLITTKSGQAGEVGVDYTASVGTQELSSEVEVMNLRQYAQFVTAQAEVIGYNQYPQLSNTDVLGTGTDWQGALFRRAPMTDHSLAVSGGTDDTQFRLSGGYTYQQGIAIESNFNRYSLNAKINNETTDWLSTGGNLNLSRTSEDINVSQDDIISLTLRQRPDIPVRTPEGGYGGPDEPEFTLNNPVGLAELNTNEEVRAQVVGGFYGNISLMENLTLNNELNGSFNTSSGNTFEPTFEFGARTNDQNAASRSSSNSTYWQLRNYLNYITDIGDLSLDVMGGHEVQVSAWEGLSGGRRSFPSNSIRELPAGEAATATNNSYAGSSSMESFFSRLKFSYLDRYLLTTNFRADASSNFSEENRWGYFPSLSGAWKLGSEPFMDEVGFVNQLKLRAGWGHVGNQNVGGYRYGDTYTIVPTQWGNGVRASNLGNPGLQWETTESINVGLDVSVLKQRVSLSVDAYRKDVENLLLQVPLPLYSGTSGTGSLGAPFDNIGAMQNRGLEFSLNTVNLDGGFRWESDVVFTMNGNEVTELRGENDFIDRQIEFFDTATRSVVGEPAGQFYGYVVEGLFESEEELNRAAAGKGGYALPEDNAIDETQGTWIGDVRFKDLNGDGIINEQDRTFIGNPSPDFQYGVTNRFSFKGFDFSFFLNGNYGNEILNQVRRLNEDPSGGQYGNMLASTFDYARIGKIDPDGSSDLGNLEIENPGTTVPRITDSDPNNNQRISTRFVEDGSYLRIQNVTLGYELPSGLAERVSLERLRVYASVSNLYTLTGYSGYDPEIGSARASDQTSYAGDPLLRGIDLGRYPSPRTLTLGVNLSL